MVALAEQDRLKGLFCLKAVMPAKAGIHLRFLLPGTTDARFRGHGGIGAK
jgi:hypothetical protein